jgi:hypothetical protein
VVVASIVVELVVGRKAMSHAIPEEWLLAGVGVFLLVGIAGSVLAPQFILSGAVRRLAGRPRDEVEPTLARSYMAACLARGVLLEGPALFGVVSALLTGNPAGYLATGIAIVIMLVTFPSRAALNVLMERATGRSDFVP